ncbi:50S ribosomal protein L2 [Microgenomates group bacterium]|nr:50S ribosomal protein L2 [Microgenomates group bacterium]
MPVIRHKPTTPGRRHRTDLDRSDLTVKRPEKTLTKKLQYHAGRNSTGKLTVRHHGGQEKRLFRIIDFKRNKHDIPARVASIEYDPNRTANIALLHYVDGEKRYILAPQGLKVNHLVFSGETAPVKPGNALALKNIPVGSLVHNIELTPGKGGQLVRSAGNTATLQSKDKFAIIKLPTCEVRQVSLNCYATIGEVSNPEIKNIKLGKAGRSRHKGIKPTVRGTAQHPGSHPHGGGEGRSGVGRPSPVSPWGKKTLGKKTRNRRKYSSRFIIKDRRIK